MKFVVIENVKEGDYYPHAFLSFGRKLDKCRDNSIKNASEVWVKNGWYVRVILPLKSVRPFRDPRTYVKAYVPCYPSFLFWRRTPFGLKKAKSGWTKWVWIPA